MLKNMKAKALALLTALAMVLGLGVAATAPAYAVGPDKGALTVTSTNAAAKGKDVTIYQMFTAKVFGGEPTYTLNTKWEGFFQDMFPEETGPNLPIAAFDYVSGLYDLSDEGSNNDNEQALIEFAKDARDWAAENDMSFDPNTEKFTKQYAQSGDKYVATFDGDGSGIALGYYLVVPQDGSTSESRKTNAILVNVLNENATVEIKSEYPTVDKTAQEGEHDKVTDGDNHASVHVGDTITFSLKSTVPDMSDFTDYTFYFTDKLSDGLTFGEIKSVKVGNLELRMAGPGDTAGSGTYTFKHPGNELDRIQIDINEAFALFSKHVGETIEVVYTAVVNENAVVDGALKPSYGEDNMNNAEVNFSTNPDGSGTGTSTPDKVHTYTFGFDVLKVDGEDQEKVLPGAKFELRPLTENDEGGFTEGDAIAFTEQTIGDETYYRPAKTDGTFVDADQQTNTVVTSDDGGMIHFIGLAEGTYNLVETQAPAGYNTLKKPVKVTIDASYRENGELGSWSVSFDDQKSWEWQYGTTVQVPAKVTVENKEGGMLPGTGGMGTVLFTVAGVALIAFGVFWSLKRAKSADRRH